MKLINLDVNLRLKLSEIDKLASGYIKNKHVSLLKSIKIKKNIYG